MPENATVPAADKPPADAGHVPITEEMDSAKWTLPPFATVALALAAVAVVVGLYVWFGRPKPGATGAVTKVAAAEQQGGNAVMVVIHVRLQNLHQKPLWVRGLHATLESDQGKMEDTAASSVDIERYLRAFPELRVHQVEPLKPETRVPPGGEASGMIMVAFPVSKRSFEGRKSLSVSVDAYDRRSLLLSETR